MSKKYPVSQVHFRKAVDLKGPQSFIATGPGWPGWGIQVDPSAREILIVPPKGASKAGRKIHVPFENVSWYIQEALQPADIVKADKPRWKG